MTLKLEHVIKKYKDFTAVNDLNFSIGEGEIFGLIGQNGAGKTNNISNDFRFTGTYFW